MPMSDLIPWGRSRTAPAPRRTEETSPFLALQREVLEALALLDRTDVRSTREPALHAVL